MKGADGSQAFFDNPAWNTWPAKLKCIKFPKRAILCRINAVLWINQNKTCRRAGAFMAIIDDLIAHYVKVNETIAHQISFIEGGGTIRPAGANRQQAADATADWLEKLMKYHAEYEAIISELYGQASRP